MNQWISTKMARWAFATGLLICAARAFCLETIIRVDVFVDDLSPIAAGTEAKALESTGALTLWNLDDLERFNTRMAQNLPRDLARAKETLAARIHAMTPAEVAALSHAATGSARAEGFHVTRLPAVLINEAHLYYGPRTVEAALQAFRAEPQTTPTAAPPTSLEPAQ